MQNGFVESFNGRLRDECLNEHLFANLKEAREISKNGGSTTTPTDRTRASTGSHQPSSQHAPTGAKPEQTLLINEDNSGSRSPALNIPTPGRNHSAWCTSVLHPPFESGFGEKAGYISSDSAKKRAGIGICNAYRRHQSCQLIKRRFRYIDVLEPASSHLNLIY